MSSKLESEVCCRLQVAHLVKAAKVNAGLTESNGKLLPGLRHVTCGLTACTPGSAPGPTLGNEYGKTLPFTFLATIWKGLCPCPQRGTIE